MKNVPLEAVCVATGLGKRQVLRLTREGRIPATIISRRFVMTAAQFEQLQREGIAPKREAVAPSFVRRIA